MGRPGNCGCCCEHEPITVPVATHRDLTTGDPHPTDNMLDGIELLWQCCDGDITGLTQETVTQNCTVETAEIIDRGSGLQARLHGIVPTAGKNFAAMQIVWTGQRFDAFAHKAHIAAGSLRLYGGEAQALPLVDGQGHHFQVGFSDYEPRIYPGVVIRSGGLLFVITAAPFGETGVNGLLNGGGVRDTCYDDLYPISSIRVLDNGALRAATLAELRDNGLTVDPVATQIDHEIGFCVVFAPTSDIYTGDLLDSYTVTWNFDQLTIAAYYALNCVVGFLDLPTLNLSSPAHTGLSNVEPIEFRGVSTTLTLTESAKFSATTLEEIELALFDGAQYAFVGQFTAGSVTVDVWYLPCQRLTLRLSNGGTTCPLYVQIDHSDGYSRDAGDGRGDDALGRATAPAFSGASLRDVKFPPPVNNNQRLSLPWYGSDCHDAASQPPTGLVIDGVFGQCAGSHPTADPSTCVTGLLPNQLEWMTNCYSLDPVAIGYRRRITDNYGQLWQGESCVDETFAPDGDGDCDTGHTSSFDKACNLHHMAAFGLSVNGGFEFIGPGMAYALHLYFDISEI
jgi:hypothetical protein